jgi:hypothetical protein
VLKEGEDYQFREHGSACLYQFMDLNGIEHTGALDAVGEVESVATDATERTHNPNNRPCK